MVITQILFLAVFVLLISFGLPTSEAACSPTIRAVNNSVIMFSKEKLSYENASRACESYGMHLATIDFVRWRTPLFTLLRSLYTPDAEIGRLWIRYIYYDKDIHRYDQAYVPSQSVWKSTTILGHIDYLDYYKKPAPRRIRLKYCFNNLSGNGYFLFIGTCRAGRGWHSWGVYYFESTYRPGLKQYFLFGNTKSGSDKIRQVNETYGNFSIFKGTFFGPVMQISVYVGATYNTEKKKWVGHNDWKPRNISAPANANCNKMALHYTNGWNGERTCVSKANYLCQVKFEPLVRVKPFDSTSIEISWDSLLTYFAGRMESMVIAGVTVTIDGGKTNNTRKSGDFHWGPITFKELPHKCHDIHVSVEMNGCQKLSLATSTKLATGDRIPKPLKHVSVDNSTQSQCIVQVVPPKYVDEFKILAKSPEAQSFHSFTSNNESLVNFPIDLKLHKPKAKVNFTISYTYCGHKSDSYEVQGFCVRPDPTKYTFFDMRTLSGKAIVAGACFLFLLVVLAVGGFCFFSKRRNRQKPTIKEKNIDEPEKNTIRAEPVYDKPIFPDELYENPLDQDLGPTELNCDSSYQNHPSCILRI